jgi:sortase A
VTAATLSLKNGFAMPLRRSVLLSLSALMMAGSAVMLGKASWIHLKAQVAQVLMERAFTQAVATGKPVKAWNWSDTYPAARIRFPSLNEEAVVLDGTSGEALAFGPGLMHEAAGIGEPGTTIIAAHRDTHFAFLKNVMIGDLVKVTRLDGLTFTYRVTNLRITDSTRSGISRTAPGFNLVLSTCYPFDAISRGDQRYLVEAVMM